MKKIVFFLSAFASAMMYSQTLGYGKSFSDSAPRSLSKITSAKAENCNTVVINDTEEENGVFIIGTGQWETEESG